MWYRLDLFRFAVQMLPPVLRSAFLEAFLKCLLIPLSWLYDRFCSIKEQSEIRLMSNGQSLAIADALRREYNTYEGDIYITENRNNAILFRLTEEKEETARLCLKEEERPAYFAESTEGNWEADFYVHVPSYLKEHEREIIQIIDHYKPAGRRYIIQYYDYE